MSSEENKELMRRFLEASMSPDEKAFEALMAPEFVAHIPSGRVDRQAYLKHNSGYINPFSDRRFDAEELVAEGETVVARGNWCGTQTGPFMGVSPAGRQIIVSAVIVERFRDGKSIEHWSLFDRLSMMQQLGLIPRS
jgi:predicted ester cyclase